MRVLNQIGCVWRCWYYPQKEILSHQKFSTMRSYNNGKVVLLTRTPLPRIKRVLSQGPSKWCSLKSTLRQTTTRLVQIVGHCGVCFQSLISSTETTLWSIFAWACQRETDSFSFSWLASKIVFGTQIDGNCITVICLLLFRSLHTKVLFNRNDDHVDSSIRPPHSHPIWSKS